MREILISLELFFLDMVNTFRQDYAEADTVDMGILLRKEKSGNVMVHTLGFGVGYRYGINKNYYKNRMLEFDILGMRAPNQMRRYNDNFANPRSYVYGKLNDLFIIRAGIGRQHLLNRKPYWGGVEVRGFYYGGLDLGLAKPTYLDIIYYVVDNNIYITDHISLEKYNPEEHFDKRSCKRLDKFSQFAIIASREAMKDSGITPENTDMNRVGVVISSGIGGLSTIEKENEHYIEKGPDRVSPMYIPWYASLAR